MKTTAVWCAALALLAGSCLQAQDAVKVDAGIKAYQKTSGISGNVSSVGSDTLNNVMALWAEGFNGVYPNVKIQIEGKGSSTAPPALTEGTAQFGPMSRSMKPEEIDKFEAKYGWKPTEIRVALDALAVFVNKDNPVKGLSIPEVDAIFGKNRSWGFPKDVTTWGQIGVKGALAGKPISLYGRNSASGTYGYFKEHALKKGDFKDVVKEQPGSAAVVQGVTADTTAIGYSGIGYVTSGVKALPIAAAYGDKAFEPTYANVLSKKYPLARYLYVYVAKDPRRGLDPLVKEFLKFVLSLEGQQVVVKDGFLPLTPQAVAEELKKL